MDTTGKPQKTSPTIRIETNVDQESMKKQTSILPTIGLILAVALVVLGGVSTGYALAQNKGVVDTIVPGGGTLGEDVEKTVGMLEEGVKYDEAEGKLVEGGIEGEGSHHLERDGGPDQFVYLTSSLVDLDAYVGQTVHVWGITNAGQKAGWLMDVAKLEVK